MDDRDSLVEALLYISKHALYFCHALFLTSYTSCYCVVMTASLQALYQSWVLDASRNILAILEDMPSLRPPVDHLCELLPRLQARYYSIASSSKVISLPKKGRELCFYCISLTCLFAVRITVSKSLLYSRFTPTASTSVL